MNTHRTIRYRLYPATREKHQKLHGTAGACRYVWNYFVGKLRDDYAYYEECDFRFFSSYKMSIEKVPAHYTSQTCNKCGVVDKNNRKTQADFKCVACGHGDNADVNAVLNILAVGNAATGRGDGKLAWSVKRQKIAEGYVAH